MSTDIDFHKAIAAVEGKLIEPSQIDEICKYFNCDARKALLELMLLNPSRDVR